MRIKDDLRRCVVFLGFEIKAERGIECVGTGFQIAYDGFPYLVTAGHIAESLNGVPFVIRVNERASGRGVNSPIDSAEWRFHSDYPNVDLAILAGEPGPGSDSVNLGEDFVLSPEEFAKQEIGPGDRVAIVGLFRLLHGKERNLPVVHTGWVAMMPEDEPIPVRGQSGNTTHVRGYLVEAQTLEGLSGAPVFVDQTWRVKVAQGQVAKVDTNLSLLGVWQASWRAPPDEIKGALTGTMGLSVPVGMGIVVPAQHIIEILEEPDMARARKEVRDKNEQEHAASLDSASPTKGDNPSHTEDFNRLLTSVATRKPRDDQT